jgi:spore coat polysaccharide biosynthesis protein SpsF
MNIIAIIQARMNSTRLPNKVMAEISGHSLLYYVCYRARKAVTVNDTVVATTTHVSDNAIAEFCRQEGIPCFRGSEEDVLDRYYQAAKVFGADVIVRLTADCPLLDPAVIDRVVGVFRAGDYDYVSNTIEVSYPDGLDAEVMKYTTLERAWREACLKSEREHVTSYIWKHPELFRVMNVKNEVDYSTIRWTVDEPEDLAFIQQIYEHFGSPPECSWQEVISFLRENPRLASINDAFQRNEGYAKSLREEGLLGKEEKG